MSNLDLRPSLSTNSTEGSSSGEKQFFCLRGYMKSGTNWVCNLLNLHPEISCVGEFHWHNVVESLNFNFSFIRRINQDPQLRDQISKHFEQAIRASLIHAAEPSCRLIGDRTPATIEPIVIQNAPHICVIRDGRDVLVSRIFHLLNFSANPRINRLLHGEPTMMRLLHHLRSDPQYFDKHPEMLLSCESVVRTSARSWARFIQQDRETIRRVPDLPIKLVRYEQLHHDTPSVRSQLYRFLGVDPQRAGPLNRLTRPGFNDNSPRDFYRSGRVGDWKTYMTDDARRWFNEEAGDVLISLGYATGRNW